MANDRQNRGAGATLYKQSKKPQKKQKKKKKQEQEKSLKNTYKAKAKSKQEQRRRGAQQARQNAKDVKKSATSGKAQAPKSHYGGVTTAANKRTFTDKKWTVTDVAKGVKKAVNPRKVKTNEKDYIAENDGTISAKSASGKAYNTGEQVRAGVTKSTTKTVDTHKSNGAAGFMLDKVGEGMSIAAYYAKQAKDAAEFYNKEEPKANKQNMTYGEKDEFVKRWLKDETHSKNIRSMIDAKNKAYKDAHTYKYSNAPVDTDTFFKRSVASQPAFAYQNVKTETNIPVYETDKNGNVKFDKNGNPIEKKDKNGNTVYQKIDTTLGKNIINKQTGGFNEKGQLTSQKGTEEIGSQTAGWFRNSKFMAGAMQGNSYVDIRRGLGDYTNAAAEDLDESTQSHAYFGGYMGGLASTFFLGQYGKMADAVIKGVTKAGIEKGALKIGAQKGFASMGFEAPVNLMDATKMATDSRGNFDPKAFALYAGLNTGLSGAMGGVIGGVGSYLTKSEAKTYINLMAKVNMGKELTEAERNSLIKAQNKLVRASKGTVESNAELANKAFYDSEVSKAVFEGGGTAEDAAKALNKAGTHVEKLAYANAIKESADANFKSIKQARDNLYKDLAAATDEETKIGIRAEIAALTEDLQRIGNIKNFAETQAEVAARVNKSALNDLTKSLKGMSEKTGITYRATTNADMQSTVKRVCTEIADKIEKDLPMLEGEEREAALKKMNRLRANADEADGMFYNGFYYTNAEGKTEVLINTESPQAHQIIIGHETGHIIKESDEKAFNEIADLLEKYAKEQGDWDELYESMAKKYPEADKEGLREELTCELLGRYVYGTDNKFIARMAEQQPSLLKRILNYFKELFGKTTDKNMKSDIKTIMDKVEKAVGDIEKKEAQTDARLSKLFGKGKVSKEANGEYMKALETGDMTSAKKMVDIAMDERGYNIRAYHGTESIGFTKMDLAKMDDNISIFSSSDKGVASSYAGTDQIRSMGHKPHIDRDAVDKLKARGKAFGINLDDVIQGYITEFNRASRLGEEFNGDLSVRIANKFSDSIPQGGVDRMMQLANKITDNASSSTNGIYEVGIKMKKPLIVEGGGALWKEVPFNGGTATTREIAQYAKEHKYDGVIFKDIVDSGKFGGDVRTKSSTVYAVFNPSQVKSADVVTRDAKGEVIPLSKRFNEKEADMKFSRGGKGAKGVDVKMADLAVGYKNEGRLTDKEILDLTGWYVPKDGEPRFNISDKDFKIKDEVFADYHTPTSDNKFISASERAGQARYDFYHSISDELGYGDAADIILKSSYAGKQVKDLRAALKKAVADGTITQEEAKLSPELVNLYKRYVNTQKTLKGASRGKGTPDTETLGEIVEHDELFRYYPDAENINVQFVDDLGGAQGSFNPRNNLIKVKRGRTKRETEETLIHEIQHWIQKQEGFASGASEEYYEDVIRKLDIKERDILLDLPNDAYIALVNAKDAKDAHGIIENALGKSVADKYDAITELSNKIKSVVEDEDDAAYDAYRNTLGEQEAVDVSDTMDLSKEELDNRVPDYVSGKSIIKSDFDDIDAKLSKGEPIDVKENVPMEKLDRSGATVESKGEPVAKFDKDGSAQFSIATYEEFGRDKLKKFTQRLVKSGEMALDEAEQLRAEMENIYKLCKEYADSGEYAPFSAWSNAKVVVGEDGKPVFTSVRKNAEYPMNIDFSTICKKRRTLDAVFNELVKRGVMDRLDLSALDSAMFVAKANDIIREHGFEAACEICFVEARRYRQRTTAENFANMYNELVDSMYKDKNRISHFNYGGDESVNVVKDGIHTADDSELDFSFLRDVVDEEREKAAGRLEAEIPKKKKADRPKARERLKALRDGTADADTVRSDTAKFLMANPSQRQRLQVGDMMGSKGFEGMQTQNPELMSLYNRAKGTGGAKSSFGDVQYMNEIIGKNTRTFTREKAYAVGGVRAQSFSDYVARMVFDYVQMFGDLSAKRLPMHVYTKEPLFVKQFGLTGAKINMSLIPDYAKGGKAAGLDAKGNYIWNTDGSFPFDEAVRLQNAEGYKNNVGTIAVGVSDEHILKMLDDPNIQMIIPYHKSSLNPVIAKARNVGEFSDYSAVQETKKAYGSTTNVDKDFPFNEELYKLSHGEDGKLLPKEQWGDPRELTNRYLTWCEENGYQPKFPQFKDHKNYYKLLEDFGLYDGAGNFKPQHDVQMKFPTENDAFGSMADLIKSGLEEDAILEGRRAADVPSITDEIIEGAKKEGWLDKDVKFSKGNKVTPKVALSARQSAEERLAGLNAERASEVAKSEKISNKQRNTAKYSNAENKSETLKELKAQKAESDARLAEIDKQIKAVNKEIEQAQGVIDKNETRLAKGRKAKTQAQVEKLQTEIGGLENQIKAKEAQIKKLESKGARKMTRGDIDNRNNLVHEVEELNNRIQARANKIEKLTTIKAQRNLPEQKPVESPAARTPVVEETPVEVKPAATETATAPEIKPIQKSTTPEGEAFKNSSDYKTLMNTSSDYASHGLKRMVDAAIYNGIDVSERVKEFNELGARIRANRGKLKYSKNPDHISQYNAEIEAWSTRQTHIASSIYDDVTGVRLGRDDFGRIKRDTTWSAKNIDSTSASEVNSALEKVGGVSQIASDVKKARTNNRSMKAAEAEIKSDYKSCLENFIKGDKDKGMQNARASVILDNIAEKLKANPEDAEAMSDLMRVVDVLGDNSTLPANVRNSAKTLATATPKGRVGVAVNAVNTLNKRYGDRINGTLSLTDDEVRKLATTEAGEELDQLYVDITARLWDNIPASRMEKFNEIRHMFMLTNIRTHNRNLFGNFTFRGIRRLSNDLDVAFQNKVFKNAIEARGGTVEKMKVSHAEIKENKDYLTDEFHAIYDTSGSVNRYMEVARPDGVPVVKQKQLNALIQFDYKALEKEDMLTFIPAFKKSYMQYIKAKGWEIGKMTEAQQKMARERALFEAEYATFRDTSAFSSWLTGKKHLLAQKQGRTAFGTAGYRFLNMALEGVIPFVKTPVNILRRAVDYSPIALIRSLAELSSKDVDTFMLGIRDLSSGLTGTGIFGLGFFLANTGHISIDTKLGSHSGSKYYDQDMGYQDYSLVINIGKVHKSVSLDWVQPMEASLFMGAAFHDMASDLYAKFKGEEDMDGSFGSDVMSALFAVTSPMLDASFMSSTKDMIETFEQRASRETDNGDPDMSGAFAQMLFADIPKNYVSSVVPQVISQAAKAGDKWQRDTSSTLKDPILASWDSAGKQLLNRIPWVRNQVLEKKYDRWGDDVKTGDNVWTRMFDAMVNPSNVKDITENKYDRELFAIRNSLEKGSKAYKSFFYNFTGKPNYELDFDKGRMNYKQANTYGREVRKEQSKIIRDMIDSPTYKQYMTPEMKQTEVDKAYWTSVYKGDQTIGDKYAARRIAANENGEDDAYRIWKMMNGGKTTKEQDKEFVDFYIQKEELYQRAHVKLADNGYSIKALAAQMYNPKMLDVYEVEKPKKERSKKYWDKILKESANMKEARQRAIEEVTQFTVGSTYYLEKGNASKSKAMQSVALGKMAVDKNKNSEAVYRFFGYDWNQAQSGAGLMLKYNKGGKYEFSKLEEMKFQMEHNFDLDESGRIGAKEARAYVESLGIEDDDEKACVFEMVKPSGAKNPWGTIKDWLEWNTEPDEYGSGGRGRRGHGRGHGGGGGGGSGKGTMPKTESGAIDGKVTNPFASSNGTKKSNLDEAYRKRLQKLQKSARKHN